MTGPALARLFTIAARSLVDDLHVTLRERGWDGVRPVFGVVLLALRNDPATVTELAGLMGVTKQAASKVVDAMVAAGFVDRGPDASDARARSVSLTGRGRDLLAAVDDIYTELERRWAGVLGDERLEALRDDLVTVLSRPEGGLPPVRPAW